MSIAAETPNHQRNDADFSKTAEHAMYPTITTHEKNSSSGTQLCTRPNHDFVREQSEIVQRYALELSPAFQYWNAAGPRLFDLAQQLLQINRLALAYLFFGCNVLALQTLLLARAMIVKSAFALRTLARSAWDSKQGRRLRKKVEFEFFVLILGCGNGFALILFWPGWAFVGLAYLVYLMWTWAG